MKKLLFILPIFGLLFSCQKVETKREEKHYEYKDFEKYEIEWNSLFFTAKTHYFAYIYSESCLHCKEIKDKVLSYLEDEKIDLFLVHFSSEISTGFDTYKTIGKNNIENIWILGTPTLIEIDNGLVVNNVAGKEDILLILESESHQ